MTRRFDRKASEVGRARRFVRSSLDDWGVGAQATALELAVSELVSNALVHGAGAIHVGLQCGNGQVELEVTDEGRPASPPHPVEANGAMGGAGGWGLRMVDEIADRWGSATEAGRTRVWVIKENLHRGQGL